MTNNKNEIFCERCKHCEEMPADVNQIGTVAYSCFRYPPTVAAFAIPGPVGQSALSIQTIYPMIRQENKACGEFDLKTALRLG